MNGPELLALTFAGIVPDYARLLHPRLLVGHSVCHFRTRDGQASENTEPLGGLGAMAGTPRWLRGENAPRQKGGGFRFCDRSF